MGKDFAWTCQRTGDCCLGPSVAITPAERTMLAQARPDVPVVTEPHETPGFLRWLQPTGCPMLTRELDGTATCTVHAVRPMNCRRFVCLREAGEPFRAGGPLGCLNTSERIEENRHALAFYQSNQRRAQQWGRAHGWTR